MIFTLKNTTRRPIVIQLEHRVSGGAFKSRSENVTRIDHDTNGNAQVRRVRLRHPPVLRIQAGGEAEVPASVMHDKEIQKRLKAQGRPTLKVLRRESVDEWQQRKADEAKAAAELAARREATAKRNAEQLAKRAAAKASKPSTSKASKKSSGRSRSSAQPDTTTAKTE